MGTTHEHFPSHFLKLRQSTEQEQQQKQALICQFPYENIPIMTNFKLQGIRKGYTVDNII